MTVDLEGSDFPKGTPDSIVKLVNEKATFDEGIQNLEGKDLASLFATMAGDEDWSSSHEKELDCVATRCEAYLQSPQRNPETVHSITKQYVKVFGSLDGKHKAFLSDKELLKKLDAVDLLNLFEAAVINVAWSQSQSEEIGNFIAQIDQVAKEGKFSSDLIQKALKVFKKANEAGLKVSSPFAALVSADGQTDYVRTELLTDKGLSCLYIEINRFFFD